MANMRSFWVFLGSFWGPSGIVLASFWVIPGQSCKEEGFLELEAEPLGTQRP